jgi:hypothetical protein
LDQHTVGSTSSGTFDAGMTALKMGVPVFVVVPGQTSQAIRPAAVFTKQEQSENYILLSDRCQAQPREWH